ncbi:MAG: NAD-dependent epimerase/dehydratase family protein [Candidatus Levybacteria bacterium]|nr:NAD-dependent epimerase/dehydratase family protein [Candidatus Levybacteria bacterium]
MDKYYSLDKKTQLLLKKVKGPIVIFGAGGFIGLNLLKSILLYRKDVYGISQDIKKSWRLIAADIPSINLRTCDLNEMTQVKDLISELQPHTIFNLAAYGAYSRQREYGKIYKTNINSTFALIETLKEQGFSAYIHAGSQSEYGINSRKPKESSELIPNSHYAVSKVANYYAVKYYGKIEKLPTIHLRLYSAYGPWEESDRLIPTLLSKGRHKKLPPLVDANISRDFIYVGDVVSAFITSAAKMKRSIYGEAFNVATGKKTTIKELVLNTKKLLNIPYQPKFGTMANRTWDLQDWYGNTAKSNSILEWNAKISLEEGLATTINWQKDINYDFAYWNKSE